LFDDRRFEFFFFAQNFLFLHGDLFLRADAFDADFFGYDFLLRFGFGKRSGLICRSAFLLNFRGDLRFLDFSLAVRLRD
jgi:hypothetical protein